LGYISAEEVVAKEPFPPFRASVKDGYAVRLYSDRSHEQIYEIIGRSDAGGENVNKTDAIVFVHLHSVTLISRSILHLPKVNV
jgi:molybdopterin biosynthesis enzyme